MTHTSEDVHTTANTIYVPRYVGQGNLKEAVAAGEVAASTAKSPRAWHSGVTGPFTSHAMQKARRAFFYIR